MLNCVHSAAGAFGIISCVAPSKMLCLLSGLFVVCLGRRPQLHADCSLDCPDAHQAAGGEHAFAGRGLAVTRARVCWPSWPCVACQRLCSQTKGRSRAPQSPRLGQGAPTWRTVRQPVAARDTLHRSTAPLVPTGPVLLLGLASAADSAYIEALCGSHPAANNRQPVFSRTVHKWWHNATHRELTNPALCRTIVRVCGISQLQPSMEKAMPHKCPANAASCFSRLGCHLRLPKRGNAMRAALPVLLPPPCPAFTWARHDLYTVAARPTQSSPSTAT